MAENDKNPGSDDSVEDPWAGIDTNASSDAADAFDFQPFDLNDADLDADVGVAAEPADEAAAAAESSDAAASPDVPSFDVLALGANDGVFSDEGEWNVEEPAQERPTEHPLLEESPLAVFPPSDTVAGSERGEGLSDADALAHLEEDDDHVPGLFDTDHDPSESAGLSAAGQSTIEIGTGRSGIVPFDASGMGDLGEGEDPDHDHDDSIQAVMPAFEDPAFDDMEHEQVEAAEKPTEAAAKPVKIRKVVKKSSSVGGIAAALSVLLGGAMSIPIVLGILFWGFKKDPFNIAPQIPESLSFLLPAELNGTGGPLGKIPGLAGNPAGTQVAARSLDDLPVDDEKEPAAAENGAAFPPPEGVAAVESGEGSPAVPEERGSEPAKEDPFAVEEPARIAKEEPREPPVAKEPPPLDLSALDAAAATATSATQKLLGSDEENPAYKKTLREWYGSLAKVGEEAAMLEQEATTSGRRLDSTPESVNRAVGRMLADEKVMAQLSKVSKMWLNAKSRPSDGVVLPAVLGTSRQVGPWWLSKVRVDEDPESPEVTILSRMPPNASEGDPVVVIGLVFEPGVVWAVECGRFAADAGEPAAAPAKPAADELFPLE